MGSGKRPVENGVGMQFFRVMVAPIISPTSNETMAVMIVFRALIKILHLQRMYSAFAELVKSAFPAVIRSHRAHAFTASAASWAEWRKLLARVEAA